MSFAAESGGWRRGFCRKEEAFYSGTDRGDSETGRSRGTGEGVSSEGGDFRANVLPVYRWKKQYVGLEIDQVRQLKQLQEENQRLKRLVADLSVDKTMLQDVLAKKF